MNEYRKTPTDVIEVGQWGINFAPALPSGVTVSSATMVVTDVGGADVTASLVSGSPAVNSPYVSATFIGGVAPPAPTLTLNEPFFTVYLVEVTAHLSNGGVLVRSFEIHVYRTLEAGG